MGEVLTTTERKALEEFKLAVSERLSNRMKQLILFGSKARGDAVEDSDIDIIAIVEDKNPELDATLRHLAYAIEEKYDYSFILSVKTVDEEIFRSRRAEYDPFYRSIRAEGVSL